MNGDDVAFYTNLAISLNTDVGVLLLWFNINYCYKLFYHIINLDLNFANQDMFNILRQVLTICS